MEVQLFEPGTVPEFTTPEWYATRERAYHLEEEPHRSRIFQSINLIWRLVREREYKTLVDLGAGDGGLLQQIRDEQIPLNATWGYDLQESNCEGAHERGVLVRYGDVVTADDTDWADIAVCTEMLEHLIDPHAFVRKLAWNCSAVVASSPFTETAESHYAYHTWAWDQEGYAKMFTDAGFEIVEHNTIDMFQVLSAVRL